MVATLAKLPLSAPHADNYLGQQNSASAAGHNPLGSWWNPYGLFGLEHGARVGSRAFRNLFRGHAPLSDRRSPQPLRRSTSRNQIAAFDMCFAPDKTVSAVWALSSEAQRESMASAHHQAVLAALDLIFLEFCSWTRTRSNDGSHKSIVGRPVAATFERITSRSGDPHLRTHCVIFNLCQADDGYFRTLDARHHLYRWQKTAGSIYRNALAWNLTRDVGLAIEHYGPDDRQYRLPGIPKELLDLWSTRTRTINNAAKRITSEPRNRAALKQAIATRTGPTRPFSSDPHFNDILWELQAVPIVGDLSEFRETFIPFQEIPDTQPLLNRLRERLTSFAPTVSHQRPGRRFKSVIQAGADWSSGLLTPSAALALSYEFLSHDDRADLDQCRSRPAGPATSRAEGPLIKLSTNGKRSTPPGEVHRTQSEPDTSW